MRILILDDRPIVLKAIHEALVKKGYDIVLCRDIYEANEQLRNDGYDVLIVDLNLNPMGLSPDELALSHHGILTGWLWLINHVFINKESSIIERTILFSAYIDDAAEIIRNNELLWPDIFQRIAKIDKSGRNSYSALHLLLNKAI